jgi:hypothetical protein
MSELTKARNAEREVLVQVATEFHKKLQIQITHAEFREAYALFSPNPLPQDDIKMMRTVVKEMRVILMEMRESLIDRLAEELGRGNDAEPTRKVIKSAIVGAGYPITGGVADQIQNRLREKFGERWANTAPKKFVRSLVSAGEQELWDALCNTYDVDNTGLLSILMRTFVLSASTGRIDLTDTPALAVTLSDDDLRRFAQSLKFKIKLRRRI